MCHSQAKHADTLTQLSEHGCTEKTGGEKRRLKKEDRKSSDTSLIRNEQSTIMAGSYHYREDAHKEKAVIKERLGGVKRRS